MERYDPSFRPRLPVGLIHRARGTLHLLLHPHKPRWTVVNETGYQVVGLCSIGCSVGEIVSFLSARYRRPAYSVHDDVLAFLGQLERAGFLGEEGGAGPSNGQPGLRRLTLYVTGRCNLRCRHCAVTPAMSQEDWLTLDDVRRLVDELAAMGGDRVIISGGEPLLREDVLEILSYAAGRVKTLLSTNGTLIGERMAQALVELGVSVQVSLDGATAATHDRIRGQGAFARAWQGIERLQRCGIGDRLALSVTVMRANVGECLDLIALAEERGVPAVRFFPLQRVGRAAAAWDELEVGADEQAWLYEELYLRLLRDGRSVAVDAGLPGFALHTSGEGRWCGLGRMLAVDATGDAYPCSLLMAPPFRLGNVREMNLGQLAASPRLREIVATCAGRTAQIAACRACDWRNFCQGSCPASVWHRQGTWWATDDLCALRQRLYEEAAFSTAMASKRHFAPSC
ncbi:MAG: PqqD family peptide modification chaperone [Anaerolineae bacterium]|nr:PqqD family peptide modification chaperone [Anaerolineae bacterium]